VKNTNIKINLKFPMTKTAKKVKKEKVTQPTKTKKKGKALVIFDHGRRKAATARVRLYPDQKGDITVNGQPAEKYFPSEWMKGLYLSPLRACNVIGKHAISVKVVGSGKMGQLGAVIQGISRALAKLDPEKFRPLLRRRGFLTRDSRVKESRKVGTGGKARRRKQSPKR